MSTAAVLEKTRALQAAIDRIESGKLQAPSRRPVWQRRAIAFARLCGRDDLERYGGNWVVPNEAGVVETYAPVESAARAEGARKLGWHKSSVVVIPLGVEGSEADAAADAMRALIAEFSS